MRGMSTQQKSCKAYNDQLRDRFLEALASKLDVEDLNSKTFLVGGIRVIIGGVFSRYSGISYGLTIKVDGSYSWGRNVLKATSYKLQPPQSYGAAPEPISDEKIQSTVEKVVARVQKVQQFEEAHSRAEKEQADRQQAEKEARKGFQREFEKLGYDAQVKASADKTLEEVTFRGDDARKILAVLKMGGVG